MAIGVVIGGVMVLAVFWLLLRKPAGRSVAAQRVPVTSAPGMVGSAGAVQPASIVDKGPRPAPPGALSDFKLLQAEDLDEERAARVASICEAMADPHPVQAKLAGGLESPAELMEAVSTDAGLTASVLRTVNSSAFALSSPITSVQHAVTYLGVNIVKGIVAQAAMVERAQEGTAQQKAALGLIWKSACASSAIAHAIGQQLGLNRPSVVATRALFSNLGDAAIALNVEGAHAWFCEDSGLLERAIEQQASLGVNSAIIGAQLARGWGLPEDISTSLENGLLPLVVSPDYHPLLGDELVQSALVYLANRIGDAVAYKGLRDIAEFAWEVDDEPDLYHLGDYLRQSSNSRLAPILEDPTFRRKANRLIASFS